MAEPKERRSVSLATILRELAPLVIVVGLIHLGLRWSLPDPRLWGDENHYLAFAALDVADGRTSLLPGSFAFDHRPELASRVFANLLDATDLEDPARAFARLELLQIALALVAVALTWLQARWLGIGRTGALLAGAIVGLHPWVAFHAHALWPEMLHTALFGLALACLVRYFARGALGWLALAGLATGYALLAKGTLVPFLPVLALYLALATGRAPTRPSPRTLAASAVFLASALLVVVPQALRNERDGNGLRLAANRWWNLELGLTAPAAIDPDELAWQREQGLARGDERWLGTLQTSRNYFEAAEAPVERERLARERTLTHVRERGWVATLLAQFPKLVRVLLAPEPAFEQAVGGRARWGTPAPLGLGHLVGPSRAAWWALLAAAALGLGLAVRRSRAWGVAALFVVYMLGALLLVPVKFRFVLPLVPVLALFAAAALDAWLARRTRTGVAPGATSGQAASLSPREPSEGIR